MRASGPRLFLGPDQADWPTCRERPGEWVRDRKRGTGWPRSGPWVRNAPHRALPGSDGVRLRGDLRSPGPAPSPARPVTDQWQALAVMGELCPHGWQAQITLYGWGAPVPTTPLPRGRRWSSWNGRSSRRTPDGWRSRGGSGRRPSARRCRSWSTIAAPMLHSSRSSSRRPARTTRGGTGERRTPSDGPRRSSSTACISFRPTTCLFLATCRGDVQTHRFSSRPRSRRLSAVSTIVVSAGRGRQPSSRLARSLWIVSGGGSSPGASSVVIARLQARRARGGSVPVPAR